MTLDSRLKKELYSLLKENDHCKIANALLNDETTKLSPDEKDILIRCSNSIKNGNSIISVNPGIAGHSPSSGGSGFLSGVREGFGLPELE